jgi:hypothetical protein
VCPIQIQLGDPHGQLSSYHQDMLQVDRRRLFRYVLGIEECYYQSDIQIVVLLAVGTKGPAFAIDIEFGSFGSKFARHVKSLCDLLKDVIVPKDGIGFELISVGLRSAPVYDDLHTVISIDFL